jgi:hypothetical protein
MLANDMLRGIRPDPAHAKLIETYSSCIGADLVLTPSTEHRVAKIEHRVPSTEYRVPRRRLRNA